MTNLRYSKSVIHLPVTDEDEVLRQKNAQLANHFQDLLNKNNKYFSTIQKQYGQTRPRLLLSLDFKMGGESLYTKDFVTHDKIKNSELQNANNMKEYKGYETMQLETINRTELVPHLNVPVPASIIPQNQQYVTPFNGGSTYNNEFINWGQTNNMTFKPPNHPTVIKDLPFQGSTFYRDNFIKYQKVEVLPIFSNKSQFKNPVSPDLPFLSKSSNQHTYKPFKTKSLVQITKSRDFTSLPAFKGQFVSTQQADFIDFKKTYNQ